MCTRTLHTEKNIFSKRNCLKEKMEAFSWQMTFSFSPSWSWKKQYFGEPGPWPELFCVCVCRFFIPLPPLVRVPGPNTWGRGTWASQILVGAFRHSEHPCCAFLIHLLKLPPSCPAIYTGGLRDPQQQVSNHWHRGRAGKKGVPKHC